MAENFKSIEVEGNEPEWKKAGFASEKQARDAVKFLATSLEKHLEGRREEELEWSNRMLENVEEGLPGEITIHNIKEDKLGRKRKQIVYCNKQGKPIAAAILKEYDDLLGEEGIMKWGVEVFVTDKSKGILSARAVKKVFNEVLKLDAVTSTGTTSPDAIKFLYKYYKNLVANLSPEACRILGGEDK